MRQNLPPLRLLTTFETVLRTGGVQNAAAELNVTQPAVSQALRNLEEFLGAKLLDRRMRPAALTDAGQILLQAVTAGMDQIGRAISQIKALEGAEQKVVTVACTICTGTYWLMPRLAAFYSVNPDITVRVTTASGVPQLGSATDLVIRYGGGNWADGESELLFQERLIPVCSPEMVTKHGAGDLNKATLLHVEGGDESWPLWKDYFQATGLPENIKSYRGFSNYVQATQAALAGMGVMLGWISNTGDLVKEGRLAVFKDRPFNPDGAFYLVSPNSRKEKPASALLSSHLRRCATEY